MNTRVLGFVQAMLSFAVLEPLIEKTSVAKAADVPPPATTGVQHKQRSVAFSYQHAARVASGDVDVRARASDMLLKRNFAEGSYVTAGQSLLLIDPAPFKVVLAHIAAQLERLILPPPLPSKFHLSS